MPAREIGRRGVLRLVGWLDRLTEVSLWLAMLALAAIVAAYCWEVVARYFFGTPTRWSAEFVSYALLFVTFMALPKVTADGAHIAVTVLQERLPDRMEREAERAIGLIGAVICLFLAWIAGSETARQAERGIAMMGAISAPKAWVSVWIAYGFALSALQFLRRALLPAKGG